MLEMFLLLIATVLHVLDRGIYYCQLVVYHLLVCIRNAKKLIFMLTHGTKTWIYMLVRLILFTLVLAPGWYNLLKYWFFDSFILRNVEYGKGARARNLLDIYLPLPLDILSQLKSDTKVYSDGAPVVIFVTGGAWIIGYKLWSALVGRALASLGILTIAPDYRNFPQGDIQDMTQDVRNAILWTEMNCSRFGGNPNKIILAGQSAGAHICLCLLVDEFLSMKLPKETKEEAEYHAKLDLNYKIFEEMVDPNHRHSGKDLPTVASGIISGRIGSPTKHQQHLKPQSPQLSSFQRRPSTSDKTDYKKPLLPTPTSHRSGGSSKKRKNEITPSQEDEFGAPEDGVEEEEEEVVELEDDDEEEEELGDDDNETYHSSTPYSDHSFQNYPIYPMNQRKKNLLEKAILKQALGEGDKRLHNGEDDEGTEPEKDGTETEEEWFGTPFEQNKTPLGSVYSSTGSPKKSAMKPTKPVDLIDDYNVEEAEKENREQAKEDEFDSSFEDESNNPGGIWKDVPGISEKNINNKSSKKHKNNNSNKNDNEEDISPLIASSSTRKHFTPTPSNKSNRKSPYSSASSKKLNNTSSSKRSSRRLSRESSSMSVCSNSLNEPIRITEKIKLFIGVSGPYNLQALESHLHKRGLDSSILHWICRGNLAECSPTVKLQQYVMEELLKLKELNKDEEREPVEEQQQPQQSPRTEGNKDDDDSHSTTTSHTVTAVAVTAVPIDSTTSSSASSDRNKKSDNSDDWSNWWILNFIHSELMIYWKKLFPDWMTASPSSSSLRPASSSSYTPAGDHYNPNALNSNDDVLIDQSLTSSVLSVTSSVSLKNKKTDCLSDFLPVALFHGSKDVSIPDSISKELAEVFSNHGASVIYKSYEDWTHTDAILEAPLYGNIKLFRDMIQIIRQVTEFNSAIFHNQKNKSNNKDGNSVDDHPQFTRKQRALSFPADYFKLPVAKQLALDDERKNKDGKKKKSSSKEKPNPSEVPLAPRFLLNIGRKLNPF
jgi:acetyl esterase/lipase